MTEPRPALVLVIGHRLADLDALGAMVGAAALERAAGRAPLLIAPEGLAPKAALALRRLGEAAPALADEAAAHREADANGVERVIVVDTARSERLGSWAGLASAARQTLAYDTHPIQPNDLPRVPSQPAAAASSLVALALQDLGLQPSAAEASLILIGIHEDSGHFCFPSTSAADHTAAALCLGWGASLALVAELLPRGMNAQQLDLIARIRAAAEPEPCGETTVYVCTVDLDAYAGQLGELVSAAREAEGWPALITIAGARGQTLVVARGDGTVDLGAVLRELGGGGHRAAASAAASAGEALALQGALRCALSAVGRSVAETTPVEDRMVRDFVRCAAEEPIDQVLDRVHRARINALPVQDGDRWTAQISRGELEAAARHGLGGRPVGEVASQALLWIAPSTPLHQANLELARARGRVVLVGEPPDRVVGLITRTTLLLAQAERSAPPHRRPPAAPLVLGMLRRALGPEAARVEALGALAAELGLGCFLVGGPVRDLLLGRPVRDIDVLVEGPGGAPALAAAAAQRFGGEVVHHAAFLTSKWRPPSGAPLDLATARAERYPGVAVLPEVRPAGVEQDLVRRDFTINAMAVDLSPTRLGRVLDPFGGWTDLGDRVLRVLHGLSFHDDPTRALRAARFAARFDLHLAPGTRGLLGGLLRAGSFARLGRERLGNELELIFNEPVPERALRLLEDWGLMNGVHPALRPDALAFDRLRAGLDRLGAESPDRARLGWLWLASLAPEGDRAELSRMVPGDRHERLRFVEGPGRTAATASALRTARRAAAAGRALAALDRVEITLLDAILSTSAAEGDPRRDQLRWWAEIGQATQTAVRGEALIAEGVARGPAIKAGLDAAQDAAWDGEGPEAQLAAAVEAARAFSRRGGPGPAAGGA